MDDYTSVSVREVKKGDRVHGPAGWVWVTKVSRDKDAGTIVFDTDATMPDPFRYIVRKEDGTIFRKDGRVDTVPVEATSAPETPEETPQDRISKDVADGARVSEAVMAEVARQESATDETPKKAPARKRTTKKATA